MADILGYLERLDDTRLVFLGQNDDEPGVLFLGFRSRDGVDTKLKISEEAFTALMRLHMSLGRDPQSRCEYPGPTVAWKGHWMVTHHDIEH